MQLSAVLHIFKYAPMILGLALLLGCSSGEPTGTVTGEVKYQDGTPVPEGRVNFYSKQSGIGGVGSLDAQGTYRISEPLPVGTYTVFIPPPLPTEPKQGVTTSAASSTFKVPAKYHTETTSDLTAEVKQGENKHSFELSLQ
jgi:hypothetical protein